MSSASGDGDLPWSGKGKGKGHSKPSSTRSPSRSSSSQKSSRSKSSSNSPGSHSRKEKTKEQELTEKLAAIDEEDHEVSKERKEIKDELAKLGQQYKHYKTAFNELDADDQADYGTPSNYRKWLDGEIKRMSGLLTGIMNERASVKRNSAAIGELLAQERQSVLKFNLWQVDLTLIGSMDVQGARAWVYMIANDVPMFCDEHPRNNIFYDVEIVDGKEVKSKNLHITLYAPGFEAANLFLNRLMEGKVMETLRDSRIEKKVKLVDVSIFDVVRVASTDYDTDEEKGSKAYSVALSSHSHLSQYSKVGEQTALYIFQSIQSTLFLFSHHETMQKAHLVDKAKVDPKKDDENNLLVMSADLHAYFDGKRSVLIPPSFTIFPDAEQPDEKIVDNDNQTRTRVNVVLEFFDRVRYDVVRHQMKEGTMEHDNPNGSIPLLKTFVHVVKPERFIKNLTWKDRNNRERWATAEAEKGRP